MQTKRLLILALVLAGAWAFAASAAGSGPAESTPTGPRPTPTAALLPPDSAPSSPAQPEALPDLVVTGIALSPADPYVDQETKVFVTIKNIGTADVQPGNNFFLDLYINPPTDDLRGLRGDYYWPVQGYTMKAGQSAVFQVTLVFTDSVSYNLWAQVDTPTPPSHPVGDVVEANEDNNIRGPEYVTVRTHYAWVQKDHVDFFRNMASTLDVVPVLGTVGIITNAPGLEINGDSALVLGIFDEPPKASWGLSPTIPYSDMLDYNMIYPDTRVNLTTTNDQRYPFIHASDNLVVVVWEDGQNAPIYGKDVFLRWSDDEGETWHEPIQVNETFGNHDRNDQKSPAVGVAPNGLIVVAWQDHRESSFDIYTQVFTYTGTTLYPCHANGDCSSPCDLAAEACNYRVDTDANNQDQIMPDIAVDQDNVFYIVWQDRRNNNDDIFAVRSYTLTVPCPLNRKGLGFRPHLPAGQPASPDQVYLCWGDDTRIHDDPTLTKQSAPSVAAVKALEVTGIEYIVIPPPNPGDPPQLVVTHIYSEEVTYVTVVWEDWREGDADIYTVYSRDAGETFGQDQRLNNDKAENSTNGIAQLAPAVALNPWLKQITLVAPTPYGDARGEAMVPVTTIHVVWQDFRHSTDLSLSNDPDIYYTAFTIEPDPMCPWPIVRTEQVEQLQVNKNDIRSWQTGPVWQGEPDVAATASCGPLGESAGYNAYVVWADGRNYGGELENQDIYFRLFSSVGAPSDFVGENNIVVNDHARLHDFHSGQYTTYRQDLPPHARQRNPSIAATMVVDCLNLSGYLYVAWDDDRLADPFVNRNIYFARSNLTFGGHYREYTAPPGAPPDTPGQGERYGSGSFISEIFDSGSPDTIWYVADWHAVTEDGTYITLQTRLGNTRQQVLNSDWYPKRFPYPDDPISKGAPLQGYDAPGQHIEDAAGHYFPQARFIQYRVNFWARNMASLPSAVELHTPTLFDVILHYERPPVIYLPAIYKKY